MAKAHSRRRSFYRRVSSTADQLLLRYAGSTVPASVGAFDCDPECVSFSVGGEELACAVVFAANLSRFVFDCAPAYGSEVRNFGPDFHCRAEARHSLNPESCAEVRCCPNLLGLIDIGQMKVCGLPPSASRRMGHP